MKLEFSRKIFEKCSNIKFNENPSSGSRVVPCERMDGQNGQTEMTKLIVAFRNVANMPNYSTYTWAYYTTGIINFTPNMKSLK